MSVVGFDEPDCLEVARAGGKGASLARMTALGFDVPAGFVVDTGALVAAMPDGGAALVQLLDGAGDDELAGLAERAEALVGAVEVPAALRDAVAARLTGIGGDAHPVAVRSSAAAEDSETASFAGQQETYLHVAGLDDVLARIRDCWASFFTERALFYRRQKGSLRDLRMAVVVQRMVSPDVAGVLFTCDPAKRRNDRMVIEAVFGLGEALVSGQVTPDHFVVKRDGTVKRRLVGVQPYALVGEPGGGTREEPLDAERGGAATLSDAELAELAAIGRALEEELGGPQDVEWARAEGRTFVLQARPVTT